MELVYLDASAVVKTIRETEEECTTALRAYLQGANLISSELLLTEVPRALHRVATESPRFQLKRALQRAGEILDTFSLRAVDDALLIGAGMLAEPNLRSLDAIHVVTALHLYPIDAFVTYDKRQAAVASRVGLQTLAPGT
jgi:hypothetical protein